MDRAESAAPFGESDELMHMMLDATPFGIHLWDGRLTMFECNEATVALFGASDKRDFIDRFYEYSPEAQPDGADSVGAAKGHVAEAFEKGQTRFEWTHRSRRGELIPCEMTLVRIDGKDESIVAAFVRDLREQKRMLSEIHDSTAQLEAVVRNYPGAICSANKDMVITIFDGLLVPNLVDKKAFLPGRDLRSALANKAYGHIVGNLERTYTDGPQDWSFEANGKFLHMTTTPTFDADGGVTGIVAKIDDVTNLTSIQRELEEALGKAEEAALASEAARITTSAMFDSNPHINIMFDDKFRLVDCNPAAMQFFGYEDKETLLRDFIGLMVRSIPAYQPDGRASIPLPDRLVKAVKDGYVNFETEIVIGGARKNLDVIFKRITYESSFAIVGYVYDITEIHERETELAKAHEETRKHQMEAEAANKAKSSFLSTMSHEIRTPMNAILGITEIQLQNEGLDKGAREALEKIYSSGDLLLGIINDILDLSKIEAGKLELMVDRYEVASLISDTAQLNIMRIGSKPIEFTLHIGDDMPSILIGDELRIKQILNNLLSNAFKYTERGNVDLTVEAEPDGDADGRVILALGVRDTGQGMSKAQIERLFDEYSRFNVETNRTTEGTGLGMSITRNLIRLMGGAIAIESEPGEGSLFTVRLPQGKGGEGALGGEMAANLRQFRTKSRAQMKRVQITREMMPYGSVLLVDDVETNIYVAKGLMAPYGLRMESAGSGFAAIEMVKAGREFDIIFMDHMMPKMDGVEATAIIRGLGYGRPIVALTANAVAGQADIFLGNGFDDFISKPIDIRQLNNILNKFIRDKKAALDGMGPGGPDGGGAGGDGASVGAAAGGGPAEGAAAHNAMAADRRFVEVFLRDADKAAAAIQEVADAGAYGDGGSLRAYTINVHGIKSALANFGNDALSGTARDLEMAARTGDMRALAEGTPRFLADLRAYAAELAGRAAPEADGAASDDMPSLIEGLSAIRDACAEFDMEAADRRLGELRRRAWTPETAASLNAMAAMILHSELDELEGLIGSMIGR
ncbi:MAG: ATP-binding protein [Oscillospiraceae bacterium]|nr:ATP-binding protein [Oscillospiraceae bacterium]